MRELIWTYEKCKEVALDCKTKCEFKKRYVSAYTKVNRNKWYELFSHMEEILKPNGYWSYEKCKELAMSCNSKLEFINHKGDAYGTSLRNGWLDDICSHFKPIGNLKKRCIYLYEFKNNIIYIGLTYDFEKRWINRLKNDKDIVKKYIDETGELPKRTILTEYLDANEASIKEGIFIKEYLDKGFILLNKAKAGSLGGKNKIWTYEVCMNESLKYETYKQLKDNNINCFSAIYKNNWQSELLSHLKHVKKPNGFWNEEECGKVASLCYSRTDFFKKYRSAYYSSIKNGWIDKFFTN